MELRQRSALVTGAARRVGRSIALALARRGCHVAVHYNRSRDEADAVVAECQALGVEALALSADLADPGACARLAHETLRRLGRVDVLINNAAVFEPLSLDGFTERDWQRILQINLTAPMQLAYLLRDELRARRGRIVNLSDAAVDRPWREYLAYAVSKGALDTLTRGLARALAPEVNVVAVAPGVAAWPADFDPARRAELTDRIPLRRAGQPEDIADAVCFLLERGDYITGATIPVDGGRHLV